MHSARCINCLGVSDPVCNFVYDRGGSPGLFMHRRCIMCSPLPGDTHPPVRSVLSGSYVINALYLVSFGTFPPRPPSLTDGDPGGFVDIRARSTFSPLALAAPLNSRCQIVLPIARIIR